MGQVRRVFVEKKTGFDGESQELVRDLRQQLGLTGLWAARILVRYDVEGLDEEGFARAIDTIFSEPAADRVYPETLPGGEERWFAVEYLPGQYDQRADSAAQCIQMLTQGPPPLVRCARLYGLSGTLTDEQVARVESYLVNPVDSRLADFAKPEGLTLAWETPADVTVLAGFISLDQAAMTALCRDYGLAMTVEDALFVRDYFCDQGRDPSMTELRVIDTYWSDHCRHTTFSTRLADVTVEDGVGAAAVRGALNEYLTARQAVYGPRIDRKPVCLMDIATMGMKLLRQQGKLPDLDASEEINACSIRVDVDVDGQSQPWLVMFKNETHNHPTEIEPFGGAATCLGGAIRDPLSGRSYVYQAMRVTGSGDPRTPMDQTLPGKLPQRVLTTGAARGYSSYGNQVGLATGQVTEIYDPGYVAKRMEIGFVVGAAPADQVVRERPAPGDRVVLLGGRTGRDGCGGATGSSKAHDTSSMQTCGAEVQKGNPPTERKLQRLFRNPEASRRIKRCNDFGAGGVCVAIGELADGLVIDLDRVPRKYEGLDGTELAISESQERMAVVLAPEDVADFIALAAAENLEATEVAHVTNEGRMRMTWRGREIVNIERAFLDTNGVTGQTDAVITAPGEGNPFLRADAPADRPAWLAALGSLSGCSQRGLAERFDSTIGAATVLMPFSGARQLTPAQAMAARLPVLSGQTDTGTLAAFGFDPMIARWSPFHGGVYAVVESLNRIACAGGDAARARLTFQEYFERMFRGPERWGKPLAALLGAFWAQTRAGTAAIGGKDSMSGTFETLDVPPTLVSFALAVADMGHVISGELKAPGHTLALLPLIMGDDFLPDMDAFMARCAALTAAIRAGQVVAAYTLGRYGLGAAAAAMALGNGIGAELSVSPEELLAFRPGAVVAEVDGDPADVLSGCAYEIVGRTSNRPGLDCGGIGLSLQEARDAMEGALEAVFPIRTPARTRQPIASRLTQAKHWPHPAVAVARPRVFIPVFPGTNCEYDSVRAFEQAGAVVELGIVRNLTDTDIEETLVSFARAIGRAQIVMLPGGFSAGDEPDGSGKFIATTLRAPRLRDAVMELLHNRDGLMLGICNGFQALIKLGLVPYGEIRSMREDSPTLTFNTIGRHQSRIARTRVISNLSPWLAGLTPGHVLSVPISHGEGRFVCTPGEYEALLAAGQIATQYVDMDGHPTMDIDDNPNGSFMAVEGITSPDGRVLGKMGHSERVGRHCYRNVPGDYDSGIFDAGIRYFR